ncbi:MAG: VOC family protein [Chloroflexi bacterium]|nr:VOC family protein [Chloroflexota bacterium]
MVDTTEYSHTTIIVGDMERALGFYRDWLGLKVVREYVMWPGSPRASIYEKLFGSSPIHFRLVALETDDERKRRMELIQWFYPQPRPFDTELKLVDPGFKWLGIPTQLPPKKETRKLYENAPHYLIGKFISPPMGLEGIPPPYECCFVHDPDGNMVELTNNDHMSSVTGDVEKMDKWYREVLGLKAGTDHTATPDSLRGREYEKLIGVPMGHCRFVRLFATDQVQQRNGGVELGQYWNPKTIPAQGRDQWNIGFKWPGVKVKNLDAAYRELQGKGVKFVSPVVESTNPNWKACLCFDPEGGIVELLEA